MTNDEINTLMATVKEEWEQIPDYNYAVSNLGNVKHIGSGKLRKLQPCPKGYLKVDLWKSNERKMFHVARLVLLVWIGKCPDGHEVAHNDGDRSNNHLTNIRYATRLENAQDKRKHNTMCLGSNHGKSKLTEEQVCEIKRQLFKGVTQQAVANQFNVSRGCVGSISTGRTWSHVLQSNTKSEGSGQ